MKSAILFTAFLMGAAASGGAMEAPGARSPIGSPTQVPSANRTSAIPSQPNLYGYVGNLTVSGNIGGGRHFRGFVPYSSVDYIDRRLLDPQSRAVSSFLRRSAPPEAFYDPRRTVSAMQRTGTSGLGAPALPSQLRPSSSKQWLESFDIAEILRPPEQRPLAPSAQTLESILEQRLLQKASEKKTTPTESLQPLPPGIDLTKQMPEPLTVPSLIQRTAQKRDAEDRFRQRSIYEQIREQLGLTDEIEQTEIDNPLTAEGQAAAEKPSQKPSEQGRSKVLLRPEDFVDPAQGRALLKEYSDLQHLAAAKSSEYLLLGEQFLKSGQFYKAADAFELACVWDRRNPLLILARSHALFAAGEYMSSAFYLSQALEMEPKVLSSRFDWASLLDSRDTFENRLTELSTWQQRSHSPELALLMGYVLFHDGKFSRARISAELARDMMPDSKAAQALFDAIQSASAQPSNP
ncbi:MAG TPA: hypothetical protein PLX18_02810 [Anaerohalosphaeraceae bacterium]|nr:hypothetical protein [Anaerohalosphaeraceae bacterium]HQG05407.1 hypothetical protein [Anaerohalosphaeraceae bacterium]HQI06780.1 hypothetical protein [Anaerohalosphaeraceae bacterium]HQJ67201.1 hypothetical protein [Anaerohalosphaeraceae bacterium]